MVGRRTVVIGPCGSSGGGGLATNNCCDTIYLAGSVDLDGLEWATDYTITLAAPIGTVTVTDQGSGTWESDVVEVTCTVDEVTVTDEYTVTMTATGNAPGEVIVTAALTTGGGYGGAAGCCATTETGFAWKYVNCCTVDPLAGWSMTRDPSGFTGKECELGGCEICVTPKVSTQKLCALLCYDPDVVWSSAFTTGCTGENTVNVFATKASPIPPNDLEVFGIEYWKVPAFQINSITEIPDPDSACNSCWVDRMNFHISQMNAGILSQGFVAFGGDKDGLASGSAGSGQEEVIYEEFDNTVACGNSTGKLRFTFALCGLTQYISTPSSVGAGRLTFEVFLTYGCVLRASYAFFKPGDVGGIDLESQQPRTLVKVHEIIVNGSGATDYFPGTLTLTPVV